MTNQELITYYSDLLISQYRNKPKARATIELIVNMFIADQIYTKVRDSFNIEDAIGVQLDVIGSYQGVKRTGYDFSGNFITLNDNDYRQLINLAIVFNYSEANMFEIQNLIFQSFAGSVVAFDYLSMRIGYYIDSAIGSNDMAQLFVQNGLLPKPTGVLLSSVIYTATPESFYGFVTYTRPVAFKNTPMNDYNDYQLNYPWLSYLAALESGEVFIEILNEDDSGTILQEDGSKLYL